MTDRQIRKLNKKSLRKLLTELRTENETLREQLLQLQTKRLEIDQAGTLAEASLKLSGIFEAAESACRYYTDNIRALSGRQEDLCRRMEQETREKCDRMLDQAKQMSRVYWDEYTEKCNRYMKTIEQTRLAAEPGEGSEMEVL